MSKLDPKKVVTGKNTRWSYCNVWAPKSILNSEPKYSVSLIISKDDVQTVKKIKAAIKAAYEEGAAILKGNGKSVPPLSAIHSPLNDGDDKADADPAYKNSYYINAKNKYAPGIVDARCEPILDQTEVYSGVYGRASVTFIAYNANGASRGITCILNNLQKIKDGEPLGGRSRPEDDFDLEDDDEDDDFLD